MGYAMPQTPKIKPRLDNVPEMKLAFLETIKFFEASEYALIQLMVDNNIWIGPVPEDPGGSGDIEWGLIPFLVHASPALIPDNIQRS